MFATFTKLYDSKIRSVESINVCQLLVVNAQSLQHFIKIYLYVAEHKIVLVGLDNAGKTTILYQFLMNEVVHTSPTIGSNVEEVVWKNIHFIMWDLGGQESLRAAWNTYYTNTEVLDICLLVQQTFTGVFFFLVCNFSSRFHWQRKA